MTRRAAADSLRRLCRLLLLPLLLVVVQQGTFLHELGHYGQPAQAQGEGRRHKSSGPCELCLAFASVACVAGTASTQPLLLAGLSFTLPAGVAGFTRAVAAPTQRIRGPPALD